MERGNPVQHYASILKQQFNIDLNKFKEFDEKMKQIDQTLFEPVLVLEDDPQYVFKAMSHQSLERFIEFTFEFKDFERLKQLLHLEENPEDLET